LSRRRRNEVEEVVRDLDADLDTGDGVTLTVTWRDGHGFMLTGSASDLRNGAVTNEPPASAGLRERAKLRKLTGEEPTPAAAV
jgi:hypothetical protein